MRNAHPEPLGQPHQPIDQHRRQQHQQNTNALTRERWQRSPPDSLTPSQPSQAQYQGRTEQMQLQSLTEISLKAGDC